MICNSDRIEKNSTIKIIHREICKKAIHLCSAAGYTCMFVFSNRMPNRKDTAENSRHMLKIEFIIAFVLVPEVISAIKYNRFPAYSCSDALIRMDDNNA